MKIVILSGGKGYRLKEETEFRPKPMVKIGEKPILWHIMKIYEHYGYKDFIVTLGYKGDEIKDYFLNQRYFQHNFTLYTKTRKTFLYQTPRTEIDDFRITFANTGIESLTGERVRRIKKFIGSDSFMLTYGDGVGNINIKELIKFHKKKKVLGTITGVHPKSRWGLVKRTNDDMVLLFRQKPTLQEYINGGFMVFENEIFKYIKPDEMIETALERLTKEKQLALYRHDGFWHAMDTYYDVEALNNLWETDPKWKIW